MDDWTGTICWIALLACILGSCAVVEHHKTERERLELERLKLTMEEK